MPKTRSRPQTDLNQQLVSITEHLERQNPEFVKAARLFNTANEWYQSSLSALYNSYTFGSSSANATLIRPR